MFCPYCLLFLLCPVCSALAEQQPCLLDQLTPDDHPQDEPSASTAPDDG